MKFAYFLRVFFVSAEALALVVASASWSFFQEELGSLASKLSIKEELQQYFMLLPIGIYVWTLQESRQLLREDSGSVVTLVGWPGYWKLRIHIVVAIAYGLVFSVVSLTPWLTNTRIGTGLGMLIFTTCTVGQLLVAGSVYWARVRIREILSHQVRSK